MIAATEYDGSAAIGDDTDEHEPLCADKVFVGYPLRPGKYQEMIEAGNGKLKIERACEGKRELKIVCRETSDYCRNFNELWVFAFNEKRFTHFGMRHDDVKAPKGWADVLIDEANRVGADVISGIIPVKDKRAICTTGLRNPTSGEHRLFAMREILNDLPETFDVNEVRDLGFLLGNDDTLLVNTGLLMVRFDLPCIKNFTGFHTDHWIRQNANGDLQHGELTEDWNFSEWCRRQGLKVFATRKVPIRHVGEWALNQDGTKALANDLPFKVEYPNYEDWADTGPSKLVVP